MISIKDAMLINDAVRQESGKSEVLLRCKCNWEYMTRLAVILEWGDPRKWK